MRLDTSIVQSSAYRCKDFPPTNTAVVTIQYGIAEAWSPPITDAVHGQQVTWHAVPAAYDNGT